MNPRLPSPARSRSSVRLFPFFTLALILALIPVHAAGQVPDVAVGQTFNGETAIPTPGGHDYIHLFSETVNPSNGSVSFSVQLPMPKGRGISLPFTYTYNSAGVYHLGLQPNGVLTFVPADAKLSPSVTWSESSFVPPTPYCPPQTCPIPPPPPPAQCNVATGFTFTDPSGTSHNLGIGVGATSVISMGQQSAPTCTVANLGTVVSGSNLGDGKVFGQFTSTGQTGLSITAVQNWSVSSGNNNTGVNGSVGPFTVIDDAGTTYFFGGGGSYDSVSQLTWALPSKIEDRNGNVISASTGIWNDTLGRPMIQSVAGGANIGGLVYPNATCVGSCPSSTSVSYNVPHSANKWTGSLFNGDTTVFCPPTTAVWQVTSTQPAWSGITLPTSTSGNPQQYNYYYGGYTNGATGNPYGLLNEVVYPDGGWVKYTWALSSDASVSISGSSGSYSELGSFTGFGQVSPGNFSGNKYGGNCLVYYATPVLASRQVSYDGQNIAQTQTFKYQTTWGDGTSTWDWTAKQTYVYTTDNISGAPTYLTVYNYQPTLAPGVSPPFTYGGSVAAQIPLESSVAYYSGTTPSNPVRTVAKGWYDMFHLSEEDTTENGLTSKVHYSYNSTSGFTVLVGKQEYDFGATSPTRTTTINYRTFPAGPNGTVVPVQPSSVIVSGSSGTAETDYTYDSYGSGLAGASGVQHDTAYGAGMTNRGNVTSMTRVCTPSCTSPTTTYNYDLTGQPASMTDPCGNTACSDMPPGASHTTTYSFTDSPAGGNAPGQSNAYLTNVTHPKTGNTVHQENFQYNYTFGDLTQSSDQNTQPSTYQYSDPFDRLTGSTFPDGGATKLAYNDSPTSPGVTSCQLITGSGGATCSATTPPTGWKTSVALMDGMFHTTQTQLVSDPDGTDSVETTYDGLGRKLTVSNPHRSGGSSTDGVSSTAYDVLGRPILITEQDGSMVHTAYDQACTSTTNALGTLVTDEAGNQRRTCTDGLGRLVEVDEPGQGASLPPTAATGSFTIIGAEQSHLTSPATSGSLSGGITVSGTEQSRIAKSGQAIGQVEEYGGTLQCTQNGFNTWIPPTGTLSINLHGGTGSTSWGGSCNGSAFTLSGNINTMASSLASNLTSSTAGVTATSNNPPFITITANLAGSGTNYAMTWNATSSQSGAGFTLSLPAALSGGVDAGQDAGSVSIVVGGYTASATYGSSSTASSVASTLFTGLSNSMSPVIPSGTNPIILTSKVTGSTSNYIGTATSSSTNNFSPPSFSAGPASFALTGGVNAVYAYDAGTVSVTVGTFTATVSYGSSDTPSTIASSLANYFNTQSGSPVTAVVSGATVSLTSSATGYAADLYFSGTSQTSQSGTFSAPSFVASTQGSNLTGGTGSSYQYSLTTPYVTLYSYDTMGNLLQVTQKGSASSSSQWRTRSFAYDSLSRLTQATNPESGTITYAYDVNSNLVTKTASSPNQPSTGTATVVTSYTYDALNRLTGKSYLDNYGPNNATNVKTPNVLYGYDGVALSGCVKAPGTLPDTYPIGRRTSMCDGSGATSWDHDPMGRIMQDKRFIGSIAAAEFVNYGFNFDGSLSFLTTPPQKYIAYTVGGAGRTLSVADTTDNINFVTNAKYAPPGELQSLTNGGTILGAISYNSRLQPMQLFYGTNTPPAIPSMTASCPSTVGNIGNIMNKTYDFGVGTSDNGNVLSIGNCLNTARSQSFSYDGLNRIASAISSGPQWGETFTIDSWGNLTNESQISGKTNHEGLNAAPATVKNQLNGFGYDAAGNMITNGSTTYFYDAENRLLWTSGERYVYDGDGKRVEKCAAAAVGTLCPTSGTNGTLYWRGTGSETLDETDLSGNPVEEYIFFNGQRIARRDVTSTGATIAVHYYFSDHLGSHSVIENATGTATEQDIDYYPYGGIENDYCTACVAQHYKFTGKERDTESGLDNFGARFDASSLGRFMTPDPIGIMKQKLIDAQQWNMYSYTSNNPLRFVDPNGMYVCSGTSDQCAWFSKLLKGAQSALDSGNLSKKQTEQLKKALDFYGEDETGKSKNNGVALKFGEIKGVGLANTDYNHGKTTITFDLDKINKNLHGSGYNEDVEGSARVAHEGQHGVNAKALGHRVEAGSWIAVRNEEFSAFDTQSLVNKGLNENSMYNLWNPNWDPSQAETFRQQQVGANANSAADLICSQTDACK